MSAKIYSWGLIVACLVLGTLLILPTQDTKPASPSSDNSATTTESNEQQLGSYQQYLPAKIEQYSAMLQHPLFNSDRQRFVLVEKKPTKPIAAAMVEKVAAPEVIVNKPRLIGVMTVNDIEMAFVLGEGDSVVTSLELGDQYKNWMLTAIEPTQIMLTYNETETVIAMDWIGKEVLQMDLQKAIEHEDKQIAPIPSMTLKDRSAKQLQKHL